MIVTGTLQSESKPFEMHDGKTVWSTSIFRADEKGKGPEAFIIKHMPEGIVRPHFHMTSQFQVAVEGYGTLGKHSIRPISVHYTHRQTGYGPIVAGPDGLAYMTLRPRKDPHMPLWMPENNKMAERGLPRYQVTSDVHVPSDAEALAGRTEIAVEVLFEPSESDPGGWMVRMPPNSIYVPPVSVMGEGQFRVVVQGTAIVDGKVLPRLGTSWVPPDSAGDDVVAGDDGLEILILQFPQNSWIGLP